jgi:hypothetical protein
MRFLPILTILALVLTLSPAVADTNTDAHAAFAFASLNAEPPKPYPDPVPDAKTITLMIGCESGKCTPVTVPIGSLVTASGGIIVPLRVENGVTIYRDHESFKGGSCQGGNCSGASTCAAGGSCSSCTTCTASASSTSQASSACSTGHVVPPQRRAIARSTHEGASLPRCSPRLYRHPVVVRPARSDTAIAQHLHASPLELS